MADIFDKHAENYSEDIDKTLGKYGANHDFFTAHKAWLIRHLLAAEGRDAARTDLLDVGCGVGKIHALLTGGFASIAGADVSDASLEVARRTYPANRYETYDGHRLPFADESFDLSLAICVFHHVPPDQWGELASEMLRVLRPGGLCLIIEHNPRNPVTRRIVNTCPLDEDAILLSPPTLKDRFRQAGGQDVKTKSIVSIPPVSRLLKRLDLALGFIGLGAQYYMLARKAGPAATGAAATGQ